MGSERDKVKQRSQARVKMKLWKTVALLAISAEAARRGGDTNRDLETTTTSTATSTTTRVTLVPLTELGQVFVNAVFEDTTAGTTAEFTRIEDGRFSVMVRTDGVITAFDIATVDTATTGRIEFDLAGTATFYNNQLIFDNGVVWDKTTDNETTTTATTTTQSPWNEEVCNEDGNKVDYWMKSNRGTKVLRAGEHSYLIKLKMSKADENKHYTMFLTWGKKNCGADFIERLGNGGVMIDLMDKSAEYKLVGKHTGQEGKHFNTVFQFENKALGCEDCLGSSTDQMDLLVHFNEEVVWGTKDPITCLGTLRAGYAGEFRAPAHIAEDVSPCVSWVQKFW